MKHVLVINLGGIGDILLSIPALKALRKRFPDAEISMLVALRASDILKRLSYINNIFIFEVGYGGNIPLGKIFKNLKILFALRKKRFDLLINMRSLISKNGSRNIKLLLAIINSKSTAGRNTNDRGDFFNIKVDESEIGKKHELEYNMDLIKALGGDTDDKNIDIALDDQSVRAVNKTLENNNVSGRDILIGIHPGGRPSRRWPLDNFLKLINNVSRKNSYKFVITAGKDEIFLADYLVDKSQAQVINLAGRLNIEELFALIKRCDCFVSNDTGPMHIAAVLKTPLIALFGPGDIAHYDPRKVDEEAIVFYKQADCAPCSKVDCKSIKCLDAITENDVTQALISILRKVAKEK